MSNYEKWSYETFIRDGVHRLKYPTLAERHAQLSDPRYEDPLPPKIENFIEDLHLLREISTDYGRHLGGIVLDTLKNYPLDRSRMP